MMVEERFGPIGSPCYLEYANDIGASGKHVFDIVSTPQEGKLVTVPFPPQRVLAD